MPGSCRACSTIRTGNKSEPPMMGKSIVYGWVILVGIFAGWSDSAQGAGHPKTIIVIVSEQKLIALEGYTIVYEFDVVTGRPGKETTHGKYNIFKKHKDYTSKTYKVEMPFTMFFSKDGKAIHGTPWAGVRSYVHAYITESVGSQGCVGLSDTDAATLFRWAPVGTAVVVLTEEEGE
jgi:lipoprotein-anchoring transpeptidase ErfK/SrfK